MKRTITIFLSITIIGLAGYWGIFFYMVSKSPLPYKDLDFNKDGNVSFSEAAYASDYGQRIIKRNGKECTEYYALKDGLTLKIACNG